MVEVRQGYKTESAPLKQMKADLMDKKINYNNIQSFWILNDVINKCTWFNNKDTKIIIHNETIKELIE